jgi:hypothetical protein
MPSLDAELRPMVALFLKLGVARLGRRGLMTGEERSLGLGFVLAGIDSAWLVAGGALVGLVLR